MVERLTRDDDDALTIVGSFDLVSQTRLGLFPRSQVGTAQ
jgi:hypothetical protein